MSDEMSRERRSLPGPRPPVGIGARVLAAAGGRVTRTEPLRIFTELGRHRRLLRSWLPFSAWVLFGTELPRRDVELLVLRTAWNSAAPYEWAQHATLARKAGLSAEEVSRVTGESGDPGWSARQRALVRAADELHAHRSLSDAGWQDVTATLSHHEVLELCFIVGHYEMVAMTLNSLGVEPEPATLARLDPEARAVAVELRRRLAARQAR